MDADLTRSALQTIREVNAMRQERDRLREALSSMADATTWECVLALGVDARTVVATIQISARAALAEGGNDDAG